MLSKKHTIDARATATDIYKQLSVSLALHRTTFFARASDKIGEVFAFTELEARLLVLRKGRHASHAPLSRHGLGRRLSGGERASRRTKWSSLSRRTRRCRVTAVRRSVGTRGLLGAKGRYDRERRQAKGRVGDRSDRALATDLGVRRSHRARLDGLPITEGARNDPSTDG